MSATRRVKLLAVVIALSLISSVIQSEGTSLVAFGQQSQRLMYRGRMIDAHAHPMQWSSDWMIETLERYRGVGVDKVVFFDGDGALKAHKSRPNEIVPSFYVRYMNRTSSIKDVEGALKQGFMWVGEALLRHWGETNTPADDPVALQIYDLCAKYQVPITIHQDSAVYRGAYEELERALEHNPKCIFVFHGWWMGRGHLGSITDLEELIASHPNLYVELAGQLEASPGPPWTEQTFIGGTERDPFAYPDGTIKEGWRNIFEKYPERFINGFDIWTQSTFTLENLKLRVDYWRNLLGQISQEAAEKIAYKNVEDLLARRVSLMTLTLSSSSVKFQDMLTITAHLRNMSGDPLSNVTIKFSLEGADGTVTSIGSATTDTSGRAQFDYKVDADAGTYWIIAYYEGSVMYAQRRERSGLLVSKLNTALTLSAPNSVPQATTITAIANLRDERGQPIRNATLDFHLITNMGRERVGSANTDAGGSASISLVPSIIGENRIEALYNGSRRYAKSRATTSFTVEAIPVTVVQSDYTPYVITGSLVSALIIGLVVVMNLRKKRSAMTETAILIVRNSER